MIKYYDPFDNEIASAPKKAITFAHCKYAKYLKVNDGAPVQNPDFDASKFNKVQQRKRIAEYKDVTDRLAFKFLAGEITKQEWLDARQAIKDKYPKVV